MRDKWLVFLGTLGAIAGMVLLAGASARHVPNQSDIDVLADQLARAEQQLRDLQYQIDDKPSQAALDAVQQQAVINASRIAATDRRFDDQTVLVQNHSDILRTVARLEGDRYVPSIHGNMSVANFAREIDHVVNRLAIHQESEVYVTNKTRMTQRITLNNGDEHSLKPDGRLALRLPTGNVSTQLVGQETVNWSVGPPAYKLNLDIRERFGDVYFDCPLGHN
jgi:hypothetical protein